ncbi:hypothetical protein As57867_005329, partial [Aphanomyces stellatus]
MSSQTSMKMYWGFASDLWAITSPTTSIYGASLIRSSPTFAYSGATTLENVLVQNGTIAANLIIVGAFGAFRASIGPFGSVDLKRVAVPQSLFKYYAQVKDMVATMRGQSSEFSKQYLALPRVNTFGYIPASWLRSDVKYLVGGNLLCNGKSVGSIRSGPTLLTGATSTCGSALGEVFSSTALGSLMGVLGANLTRNVTTTEMSTICSQALSLSLTMCSTSLVGAPSQFLLNTTLLPDQTVIPKLQAFAQIAQQDV